MKRKISALSRLMRSGGLVCAAGAMIALGIAGSSPAQAPVAAVAEPATPGTEVGFRRLSEEQYVGSIHAIFGPDISVPGRFDPSLRADGLLAIGDSRVAVSASGFEQYELRAREIAAKIMAPDKRATYLTCKPASEQKFDKNCASIFLGHYGRLLYRRPLTAGEMATAVKVADMATVQTGNFYQGLQYGLSRLLASPNFIFRVEHSEAAPGGGLRLDSYSLASRLSFLLWNAPPDEALLTAASDGTLHTAQGLDAQVDRMIASPNFVNGVRAFFSDMFAYDQFAGLSKDQAIYPKYTSQLAKDAHEQALQTIVDLLVTNHGDYRDLFTTKKTFLNRNLGSLYRVPLSGDGVQGWVPYTFGANDPRAGILTLVAFLMLDPTHEGRSSPTIRGKSVRELFLCQPVPPPPANVNFSIVQNTDDPVHPTARQRLAAHADNPVCAGCHKVTDPLGLSMENYDAVGAFRTQENKVTIDASGKFEGKDFHNILDLEQIMHDSPTITSCVVQRTFEYGVGRQAADGDGKWLDYASQRFADDHYSFPALMRTVATSKAFQNISLATVAFSDRGGPVRSGGK